MFTLPDQIAAMPPIVQKSFFKAGWKHGGIRIRTVEVPGIKSFPFAAEILRELNGIEIHPTAHTGATVPMRIKFGTGIVRGYEDEVRALGNALCVSLFPIADVGNGVAILLLAESGELLLLGYATPGVYLAGKTFAEGIAGILGGSLMSPLFIVNDPGLIFRNPDLGPEDPPALTVPLKGLSARHGKP